MNFPSNPRTITGIEAAMMRLIPGNDKLDEVLVDGNPERTFQMSRSLNSCLSVENFQN
jgi:hypothetical protein